MAYVIQEWYQEAVLDELESEVGEALVEKYLDEIIDEIWRDYHEGEGCEDMCGLDCLVDELKTYILEEEEK